MILTTFILNACSFFDRFIEANDQESSSKIPASTVQPRSRSITTPLTSPKLDVTPSPSRTPALALFRKETPTRTPTAVSSCPITPIQEDFWDQTAPVAGEFPIWMSSWGQSSYSRLGPKVLPPPSGSMQFVEGHLVKTGIFIDQEVEGNLLITGRQLDGDNDVFFPGQNDRTTTDEGILQLLDVPPNQFIIRDAHIPDRAENPAGKVVRAMSPLYISAGCYQFTFTIAQYTVYVVLEILDD